MRRITAAVTAYSVGGEKLFHPCIDIIVINRRNAFHARKIKALYSLQAFCVQFRFTRHLDAVFQQRGFRPSARIMSVRSEKEIK